ncbi:MAG: MATE family efflux transporter [Deltaproteobacteria bacterium]|nr:MAG: MATE family efflux transporter [Deltaproteobacteria bacterium]
MQHTISYTSIGRMAFPVILANSSTPLLGMVDTAVLGQMGSETDLGAIALSSMLFSFLYWGVGFLRMSTSGFVAQAHGARDQNEEASVVYRSLLFALVLGVGFLLLQAPIGWLALTLMGGSPAVEQGTAAYFYIRIWAAPSSLMLLVWMGYFIGRGETKLLLGLQFLLNGCNIVLDLLFAGLLGWGIEGIAVGTLIASWVTCLVAGMLVFRRISQAGTLSQKLAKQALRNAQKLRQILHANSDILVRTLFLISSFAYFTDQGARFGDVVLAGNHVLLQFLTFSTFFLDGYAHVTESLVGQAWGSQKPQRFREVVKVSTLLAAGTALCLGLGTWGLGEWLIPWLSKSPHTQAQAVRFLPWTAAYIILSFAAFQLDGIFIGCTQTRALRNASIASALVFLALSWPLIQTYQNVGLWGAFLVFVVARAVALLRYYPSLLEQVTKQECNTRSNR